MYKDDVWIAYERIDKDSILQQGDLIKFNGEGRSHDFGLVVTADCDLDKRKHSRLVTLVPLMSVDAVICKCLALDYFELQNDSLKNACRREYKIEESIVAPAFLGKLKSKLSEAPALSPIINAVARVVLHMEHEVDIATLRGIVQLLGQDWVKQVEKFKNQMASRGDILMLTVPSLIQSKESVVWMRALWQEPISQIALRNSEESSRRAIRVAQLASPYRYRLTQMLGQIFSDIGLPDIPHDAYKNEFEGLKNEL